MAIRLEYTTGSVYGTWTEFNTAATPLYGLQLRLGYSRPGELRFLLAAAEHTLPLTMANLIRVWDDAGTNPETGSVFSASAPLFLGWIEEVNPGDDGHTIEIVAYDPTVRVMNFTPVMSGPWSAGTPPTTWPLEGANTFPRLVFNATIDNDDDYAYEREHAASVGKIIQTILADAKEPMKWLGAAPQDGSNPWDAADFDPSNLTGLNAIIPQEKVVFESENVRSAIERVLAFAPGWKFLYHPSTRRWRFRDLTAATAETLTLNRSNDSGGTQKVVLSKELRRSLEGRYTAIKLYGPPTQLITTATTENGSLTDVSDWPYFLPGTATLAKNKWRITDVAKRSILRTLPEFIDISINPQMTAQGVTSVRVKSPQLQVYFPTPADSGAAREGWYTVTGWYADAVNGIITTYLPVAWRNTITGAYQNPTHVRFVYAYPEVRLGVRAPALVPPDTLGTYEGTAYTVFGITNTKREYDELLATNYEYNNPQTTTQRLAKYQTLANEILKARKDATYTGGLTLDGVQYGYVLLNKRINLTAVNQDNVAITTGWEAINAWLTDVELDFSSSLTMLTINSDQSEMLGFDTEALKSRLRIKALEKRVQETVSIGFSQAIAGTDPRSIFSDWRPSFTVSQTPTYIEADTGRLSDESAPTTSKTYTTEGDTPQHLRHLPFDYRTM
jgi:hypothetical protein